MTEANRWADRLQEESGEPSLTLDGELGELQFFALPDHADQSH
jgi:hypothetical protein